MKKRMRYSLSAIIGALAAMFLCSPSWAAGTDTGGTGPAGICQEIFTPSALQVQKDVRLFSAPIQPHFGQRLLVFTVGKGGEIQLIVPKSAQI